MEEEKRVMMEEKDKVIDNLKREIDNLKLMHQQELFILKRKDKKDK